MTKIFLLQLGGSLQRLGWVNFLWTICLSKFRKEWYLVFWSFSSYPLLFLFFYRIIQSGFMYWFLFQRIFVYALLTLVILYFSLFTLVFGSNCLHSVQKLFSFQFKCQTFMWFFCFVFLINRAKFIMNPEWETAI